MEFGRLQFLQGTDVDVHRTTCGGFQTRARGCASLGVLKSQESQQRGQRSNRRGMTRKTQTHYSNTKRKPIMS